MSSSRSSRPAGEQWSAVAADRQRAGHLPLDAAQLAQSKRRAECGVGAAPDSGADLAFRPGLGVGNLPPSPRERSSAYGARHFKKSCGHLLGTAEMRVRLIGDFRAVWPGGGVWAGVE